MVVTKIFVRLASRFLLHPSTLLIYPPTAVSNAFSYAYSHTYIHTSYEPQPLLRYSFPLPHGAFTQMMALPFDLFFLCLLVVHIGKFLVLGWESNTHNYHEFTILR